MNQQEPNSQPASRATSRGRELLDSLLRWQIKRDINRTIKHLDWCAETAAILGEPTIEIRRAKSELELYQPGKTPGVHTNPSLVMIARCAEFKADPPDDDWDGRYVMETK